MMWVGCGSSNNSKISYLTLDSNNQATLYTISSDGKTSTPVSITIPADAFYVQPNQTATEVTYCRYDADDYLEIFIVGKDNQEKQLTFYNTDGENCYPSFSHGGDQIIFNSDRDDYIQIYTINTDGSGQKRLITSTADDIFPKYSPDDSSFAFLRLNSMISQPALSLNGLKAALTTTPKSRTAISRPHSALKSALEATGDGIYQAKADGTNPTLVLADDTFSIFSAPVFSSDGRRILFSTGQFNDYSQIASVKTDGSDLKNLSNSEFDDYAPYPYGSTIMFNRYDNQVDIYSMNSDGSNQKNLTNTTDQDEYLPDYMSFF